MIKLKRSLADQVVLMNQVRVEQVASPRVMYEAATLFAAKFIGTPPMVTFSPNLLAGAVTKVLTTKILPLAFAQRRWCQ